MKVINYEKTNGSFKVKYLDDDQVVSGTINIDKDSLNLNALTTKLIIDNSVGDKVKITNDQVFEIVEKNIIIEYDVLINRINNNKDKVNDEWIKKEMLDIFYEIDKEDEYEN